MLMNRFFGLFAVCAIMAGCASNAPRSQWSVDYGGGVAGTPAQMQYGTFSPEDGAPDNMGALDARRMAVLLPMSGRNAAAGRAIRNSVELAVLQRAPQNLSVSFYDISENASEKMAEALAANPEIIIGPVFSGDARMLREMKDESVPVLSFTSDATAVGQGVMTMALMPTNSVEAIVREMQADQVKEFVILAPDTESGKLMAGTARSAASYYDIPVAGVFFYTEKDSDSIKAATQAASMNTARTAANTRAREILSDILTNERLTALEKSSLTRQLDKLSKSDTLGTLPYDAVLFLGSGDDAKSLASFLRYYGVGARDARFYGTALWDGSGITSDFTMIGAKFAALPEMNAEFANVYEQVAGVAPTRLATFGYDATNMAMGMIYSSKSNAAYLLDPSGYVGMDGLMRLTPTGASQRALRIVALDGSGTAREVKPAATNFMLPLYNIEQRHVNPASAMSLQTPGVNPMNYIQIPERLRGKYSSKTYGANMTENQSVRPQAEVITVLPEDDSDIIESVDFQPVNLESVNRTYIDSIEIEE